MRPFPSLAMLLLSLLAASPALAAPELSGFESDPLAALATDGGQLAVSAPAPWRTAMLAPGSDLPLPRSASLDTSALFRQLLLGRDLRGEGAGQGDLVGLLPVLRERERARIFELRGDSRDAREAEEPQTRPHRIGMR